MTQIKSKNIAIETMLYQLIDEIITVDRVNNRDFRSSIGASQGF